MSLNQQLKDSPMAFAEKYCIKAGDVAGGHSARDRREIDGYKYSKMMNGDKISFLNCWKADLGRDVTMRAPKGTYTEDEQKRSIIEGADTICITAQRDSDDSLVPAFFLPWDTRGGTVALRIPAKAGFAGSYPKFFLTAAINGCSVFVSGTPKEPRVYHGGKGTGVDGDAAKVWRDMVVKISGKTEDQLAEVNKTMYVKDGVTKDSKGFHTTPTTKKFEGVLARHYDETRPDNAAKGRVEIKEVRPWGAFFGVCSDAGDWTFYLQENATISYDLYDRPGPENHHFFDAIRRKFKKPAPIVGRSYSVSRPMTIRQIFPGGGGGVVMQSHWKWNSLRG